MILDVPDDLAECSNEQLATFEREGDALRVRALVELGIRGRNADKSVSDTRLASRPPWARTVHALLPGHKGRLAAAAVFMFIIMFPSLIGPLRSLYERYETEKHESSAPRDAR